MTAYRNSDMGKVRTCYNALTKEDRSCLVADSFTMAQASSIEQKLQRHGLSLLVHSEELKRCIFDDKVEKTNLEEKVELERKTKTENESKFGIFFTKQGNVEGDLITPLGGLSIAKSVGGNQEAGIGAAINYAQHVGRNQGAGLGVAINYAQHVGGNQWAGLGAAVNYAQHVGRDQWAVLGAAINYAHHIGRDQGAGIGAAINYAHHVGRDQWAGLGAINYAQHVDGNQVAGLGAINCAGEVMGSQFAITGCAVNIAKRVGKNQVGLLNIVTEIIKGKQIGLFNYAKKLGKGAKQFGLVNLEAKHSAKTKKQSTSGPETWWNPEITLFYRKGEEQGETIEDTATDTTPTQARINLDKEEQKIRVAMDGEELAYETVPAARKRRAKR